MLLVWEIDSQKCLQLNLINFQPDLWQDWTGSVESLHLSNELPGAQSTSDSPRVGDRHWSGSKSTNASGSYQAIISKTFSRCEYLGGHSLIMLSISPGSTELNSLIQLKLKPTWCNLLYLACNTLHYTVNFNKYNFQPIFAYLIGIQSCFYPLTNSQGTTWENF